MSANVTVRGHVVASNDLKGFPNSLSRGCGTSERNCFMIVLQQILLEKREISLGTVSSEQRWGVSPGQQTF